MGEHKFIVHMVPTGSFRGEEKIVDVLSRDAASAKIKAEKDMPGYYAKDAKFAVGFELAAQVLGIVARKASNNRLKMPAGMHVLAFHYLEIITKKTGQTADDVASSIYKQIFG